LLHFAITNIKIVSVLGPLASNQTSGPLVAISLQNLGTLPLVSLNASLRLSSQISIAILYVFIFVSNRTVPLAAGNLMNQSQVLVGGGFDNAQSYHLILKGAFSDGSSFSYIEAIRIIRPG
jgi:hypothetical protein